MLIAYLKKADPYSVRMKEFLMRKGLEFEERYVDEVAGRKPPLLFNNDVLIGDYEKVSSLDLKGKLDGCLTNK